ncbi:hypothetical protein NDU88_007492 [Pleurodeles waltl]|uniref:Uncharacterized protein n=1 Tax=Pleurodeles waltl TaxID=8319 RepID=A0AAV7NV42_PLEWA|nr:hypothetical protein NDU88_007492 [Pleurodeles waltl]
MSDATSRHRIVPQDREGCRLAVQSASAASYCYLLGAVSLPCRLTPFPLVVPLRARSPSGTCGGGCGGCEESTGGTTCPRAQQTAASAVVTPICHPSADRRIGAAFWHFGATPHHIAPRAARIAADDHKCGELQHLLSSPRLTTVKENCQELTEAVGDTPMTQHGKLEPFKPSSIKSHGGQGRGAGGMTLRGLGCNVWGPTPPYHSRIHPLVAVKKNW